MQKNQRARGLISVIFSLLLGGWDVQIASAQTPDPGMVGPFAVTWTKYGDSNKLVFTASNSSTAEVVASVHYPTELSKGPFPLVLFQHGQHGVCFKDGVTSGNLPCTPPKQPIPSFEGYDYIAEVLASHGYIVISMGANGFGRGQSLARAELIQHHLGLWKTFNTTGGAPFENMFIGRVDLNNVGTMGHSQGGEGVVRHFLLNESQGSPFGINAVLLLAPGNRNRFVINDVPLAVMLPYCDGDLRTLEGVHYFDDTLYNAPGDLSPKHLILVMGANHNFYNTIWTPSVFAPGSSDDFACKNIPRTQGLTDVQQRGTGIAYITGFFRKYLGGESQFTSMLTGDTPPPPSAMTNDIFVTYHAPDDPSLRRDVNRILDFSDLTSNTLGGAVTQNGLIPYDLCGGKSPQPRHCLLGSKPGVSSTTGVREPHTFENFKPKKRGLSQLRIGWDDTAIEYVNELPKGKRDVSGYFALQFRVGVNFTDDRNAVGENQDFSVSLTDGMNNTVSVNISDLSLASRVLFYPPEDKVFLNGLRIPLSEFKGVDLTDLRSIQFGFDQNSQGALFISDIAFTNTGEAIREKNILAIDVDTQAPGIQDTRTVAVGDVIEVDVVYRTERTSPGDKFNYIALDLDSDQNPILVSVPNPDNKERSARVEDELQVISSEGDASLRGLVFGSKGLPLGLSLDEIVGSGSLLADIGDSGSDYLDAPSVGIYTEELEVFNTFFNSPFTSRTVNLPIFTYKFEVVAEGRSELFIEHLFDDNKRPLLGVRNNLTPLSVSPVKVELRSAVLKKKLVPGDLDGDRDVDKDDLNIILDDRSNVRNVDLSSCGVACDLDKDDKITALDARKLTFLCTRPRCATE